MTAARARFHWRTGDMEGRGNVVCRPQFRRGTLRSGGDPLQSGSQSGRAPTVISPSIRRRNTSEAPASTSDPDFKNIQAQRITGTGGRFVVAEAMTPLLLSLVLAQQPVVAPTSRGGPTRTKGAALP